MDFLDLQRLFGAGVKFVIDLYVLKIARMSSQSRLWARDRPWISKRLTDFMQSKNSKSHM